jgi:hypothetical protein
VKKNPIPAWGLLAGVALTLGVARPAASQAFKHPGVINTRESLDFIRGRVQAGAQPWLGAYNELKAHSLASLSRVPRPRAVVECGPSSNPNNGCTDERDDAAAAYAQALLWYIDRDPARAQKAIQLMNAWSPVITDHTNHNARLQTGWAGSNWTKAAEIIRHTGAGWSSADVSRFRTMLLNVYYPEIQNGAGGGTNGNWELTMIDAMIGIGVFADDRAKFDRAVSMWRRRVPAFVYITSDGGTPVPPPGGSVNINTFWHNPGRFVEGLGQETCRDLGHLTFGLAPMLYTAETARIQGIDLYGEQSRRIRAGLEYNARIQNGWSGDGICGGTVNRNMSETLELGHNHYVKRLGFSMPHTLAFLQRVRPTNRGHHIVWETMTHGDIGSPSGGGGNLAQNRPVTVSSQPQPENPGSAAVDGSTATRWSATGYPQWLEVDLGSVRNIGRTQVVSYQDRAYQFRVEVRTTATGSFTEVVDRSSNTTPGTVASPITNTFAPTEARYVRITVTGAANYTGTWASLLEFRVFEQ